MGRDGCDGSIVNYATVIPASCSWLWEGTVDTRYSGILVYDRGQTFQGSSQNGQPSQGKATSFCKLRSMGCACGMTAQMNGTKDRMGEA